MSKVAQIGRASVWRKESFNHRTTAKVEWVVKFARAEGDTVIVRECKTRKDALQWAEIYKD